MQANDIINGRYLLVRPIGRGSFGEVWLATDQTLGLDVAIKIYIALDSRGLAEFKNEFKSVYNLHHPNLLRADYFDSEGSNPYLVMPYCPESVGNKVGNMSEPEIWEFVKGVANGLAYLHNNDIIHRDIKPDNILIDEQGNYVITDFGLSVKMRSTLRKASARQNDSGSSGTIGYMAPEMFSARPEAVKATDIWALGATIYEVATGEMPFCGQGGIMEMHGAELPALPSQYSPKLTELMHRCLAKDTWERPTAQDIVDSLANKPIGSTGATGDRSDMVSRETYEYETGNLRTLLEKERNARATGAAGSASASKGLKVWAWTATAVAVLLLIICLRINGSRIYWEDQYFEENNRAYNLNSELYTARENADNLKSALDKILTESPVLATNIKVWNSGDNPGSDIYSSQSTYICSSADFISNEQINDKTIYMKFYTPWGMSTGTVSPSGYTYFETVSLSPYTPSNIEFSGWGGKDKGHWGRGNYRVEYWYDGKCIGSKSFTVK